MPPYHNLEAKIHANQSIASHLILVHTSALIQPNSNQRKDPKVNILITYQIEPPSLIWSFLYLFLFKLYHHYCLFLFMFPLLSLLSFVIDSTSSSSGEIVRMWTLSLERWCWGHYFSPLRFQTVHFGKMRAYLDYLDYISPVFSDYLFVWIPSNRINYKNSRRNSLPIFPIWSLFLINDYEQQWENRI